MFYFYLTDDYSNPEVLAIGTGTKCLGKSNNSVKILNTLAGGPRLQPVEPIGKSGTGCKV